MFHIGFALLLLDIFDLVKKILGNKSIQKTFCSSIENESTYKYDTYKVSLLGYLIRIRNRINLLNLWTRIRIRNP